jgi:hypothetical protein
MGKVKFVTPSGKVIALGEKALLSTSLRTMGYKPLDEVVVPVPPAVPMREVTEPIVNPVVTEEVVTEEAEKPKRGRPRKNTVSDADQA